MLKRTVLAALVMSWPHPVLAADLSQQECEAFRAFLLSGASVIREANKTNQLASRLAMELTLLTAIQTRDGNEATRMIQLQTKQSDELTVAINGINNALADIQTIVQACH
jgi:phosphotransferase system HPr-like phosphotransfer protein